MEDILEERQQSALCPGGWTVDRSSCYKLLDLPCSYQDAQVACEQEGAYVAVANDVEENAFIKDIAANSWLGCNSLGVNNLWTCPDRSDKTYAYFTGASPSTSFWYWDSGQPEYNNDEHCQALQPNAPTWHSYQCSSIHPVICELSVCPGGWTGDRSSCYKLLDQSSSYQDAQVACEQKGAYVAVANDVEENAFIKGIAANSWLGCNSLGVNNLWTCPDGSDKTYEYPNGASPSTSFWCLRLAGSGSAQAGRVEVLHNGQWGTICDDSWDAADARVVCRQLGLPYSNAVATSDACGSGFGQGSGEIWLDDVSCTGSEGRLDQCGHIGWGSHNCQHSEDAGVVCV